jgi:hypothetical protein
MRECRRARRLGAKFGDGKAGRKGKKGSGERKPKRCIAEREAEPDSGEHKGRRYAWIGLVGEAEIGDDAAGKKHRQPQEPAVRLGLERAGGCGKAKGQQCPSAPGWRPILAAPILFAPVRMVDA